MKKFELNNFIQELHNNEFVKKCIPLGYRACFPIIKVKNDKVFLVIPFNKIQRSKKPGVSAVLPIAYTITMELFAVKTIPSSFQLKGKEAGYADAKTVCFESLKCSDKFDKVAFSKTLEVFPHKALEEIGKDEYKAKISQLYSAYDAVINDLLGLEKCSGVDKLELKQTLSLLLGPVTKLMYKMIDADFAQEYLSF